MAGPAVSARDWLKECPTARADCANWLESSSTGYAQYARRCLSLAELDDGRLAETLAPMPRAVVESFSVTPGNGFLPGEPVDTGIEAASNNDLGTALRILGA